MIHKKYLYPIKYRIITFNFITFKSHAKKTHKHRMANYDFEFEKYKSTDRTVYAWLTQYARIRYRKDLSKDEDRWQAIMYTYTIEWRGRIFNGLISEAGMRLIVARVRMLDERSSVDSVRVKRLYYTHITCVTRTCARETKGYATYPLPLVYRACRRPIPNGQNGSRQIFGYRRPFAKR